MQDATKFLGSLGSEGGAALDGKLGVLPRFSC